MRQLTFSESLNEVMTQEMKANDDVYLLGEDIGIFGGAFGVTYGMIQELGPEKVINTPISEAAVTGLAVGSALTGMRPIFEFQFSDFITVAIDQIVNQAAKMRYMFGGKGKVPIVSFKVGHLRLAISACMRSILLHRSLISHKRPY